MSFPKRTVSITPVSGIANDIPASQVPPEFFTSGNNMQFRQTFATRSPGHEEVYTGILSELRNIHNLQVGSTNFWVYQGKNTSSVVTEATHTDITIAGGLSVIGQADNWTSGLLNGVYFANNGIDAPMFWDGIPANKMTVLTGFPASTTVKAVRSFKNFLFGMDVSGPAGAFPMQVIWSDAAEAGAIPSTWTPAKDNLAGDASLSETPGPIIDGLPLGPDFIFYKSQSAYSAQFVGGQNVFNFRRLPITTGVLARNCIADVNGKHFVVTDGDVIITDGQTAVSIIDNKMRKFLFDSLDQDNFAETFVVHYTAKNEVWVCFPTNGNSFADTALIWDTQANSWGERTVPLISHAAIGVVDDVVTLETWDSDSEEWDLDHVAWNAQDFSLQDDSLVLAKSDDVVPTSSQFFQVDKGTTFDGVNINASITKASMSFGEPERVKAVRRIHPHITGDPGTLVFVRTGSQITTDGPTTFAPEQTYIVGTTEKIDTFSQGKYISFEFRSDGLKAWTLESWDVEVEQRGYF